MTCYVVLGMHRSGTSLVAQMMHQYLGVRMGTRFRMADRWNRGGYYEDLDFRDLDELILYLAGGDWAHPPDPLAVKAVLQAHKAAAKALVAARKGHGPWGWKSPRSCFTLPLYWPYLDDPHIIHVQRDTGSIVHSLMRREADKERNVYLTEEYWRALANHYGAAISAFLSQHSKAPLLTLHYDNLTGLLSTAETVSALAGFVGCDDPQAVSNACQLVVRDE